MVVDKLTIGILLGLCTAVFSGCVKKTGPTIQKTSGTPDITVGPDEGHRPTVVMGNTVLLRQMGRHAFLLGRVDGDTSTSVSPSSTPEADPNVVQGYLTGQEPLTSLGIFEKDFVQITKATGRTKVDCGQVIAELAGEGDGEYLAIATHPLHLREVRKVPATAAHRSALAKAVPGVVIPAKPPRKEYQAAEMDVYEVDLDGDGTIETIEVAISEIFLPEVRFTYSVLSVSSEGSTPEVVGYQKSTAPDALDVMTSLVGIADLNHDGSMEVLVQFDNHGFHYHGFVAYTWNGALTPLMSYVWGESDCYPELNDWAKPPTTDW